jgi:hypothetical protein
VSEEDDDEFDQIKQAWKWSGVILGLLTYGVTGYIQHLLQPYFSFWQLLWTTLPLAVAAGLIVFLGIRQVRVTAAGVFGIIVGTLAASVITGLTSGTRVFDYLYHPEYRCAYTSLGYTGQFCYQYGYSAPSGNLELAILSGYVHIYGVAGFIGSIVAGGFVGLSAAALIARAERKAAKRKAKAKKPADEQAAGAKAAD